MKHKKNLLIGIKSQDFCFCKLEPLYVTGFADGESFFTVNFSQKRSCKTGWSVTPVFGIGLHVRDISLLYKIQSFFGVGYINISKTRDSAVYSVKSIKDLNNIIIPHFLQYPLITRKIADFLLFKMVVELMIKKEHLSMEGLMRIVSIKGSMNNGLTAQLNTAFPDTIPQERPIVDRTEIINPNWLVGFTEGEGCFEVKIQKSKTIKTGVQVSLRFTLSQHSRDYELMSQLKKNLGCGHIYLQKTSVINFSVEKFPDIFDKIIPFFYKYPLQGTKVLDFKDFCKAASLMKNKAHLTTEGLKDIFKIKSEMNKKRKI